MAIFLTARPLPMFPRQVPGRHLPYNLSEMSSLLAIHFAMQRRHRILLFSGVKPTLIRASRIQQGPGAIRVIRQVDNQQDLLSRVEHFCAEINDCRAVKYGLAPRLQPVVIINDVDYFVAGRDEGLFVRSCDPDLGEYVSRIDRTVQAADGQLIVMAVRGPTAEAWPHFARQKKWHWITSLDITELLQPPQRVKRAEWEHDPTEEPPKEYFGPLEGSKKDLVSWIFLDGKNDYRRLVTPACNGTLWIRRLGRFGCEVWFRDHSKYAQANGRYLANQH